jgi:hypothetical protein
MYVWSGSAWVSVASEVESLATYATQSYADNTPGSKLIVPSSVAVGSGSGSVATQGTVSFSGASSVSLNNVFSSTYRNYKIIITGTGPSDTLNFRLRVSGADATGSEYWYGFMWLAFNAAAMQTPTVAENATSCKVGEFGGSANAFTVDITGPFLAATTAMNMHNSFSRGTSTGQARTFVGGCFHDLATSYDGFTFYCDSGTMTGNVSVYGYKAG